MALAIEHRAAVDGCEQKRVEAALLPFRHEQSVDAELIAANSSVTVSTRGGQLTLDGVPA